MLLYTKEYCLTPSACDEISADIVAFCVNQNVDGKDVLRYRLSAEESLLNWLDKGCKGRRIRLKAGRKLFSAYIIIEMDGSPVNPDMEQSEELGEYCNIILINLSLKPAYSYTNGRNSLYYQIQKKAMPQIQVLGIVVAMSILVGVSGALLIPDGLRQLILESIIYPMYRSSRFSSADPGRRRCCIYNFIINGWVFWKRVLPVYQESFSNEPET